MILCHKCSGVLSGTNDKGLLGCGCISGYVRGFEPDLTRSQAIAAQIREQHGRIELYKKQGRDTSWITDCEQAIARLGALDSMVGA